MSRFPLILILLCTASSQVFGQGVYVCPTASGKKLYSDQPCEGATAYEAKGSVTAMKSIKLPASKTKSGKPKSSNKKQNQACPFLTSTQVRNLKVKDKYAKGLTQAQIIARHGQPDEVSSVGKYGEKWKYKGEYQKHEFKFKHGCLSHWKSKWLKNKSRISKYQN